MGKNNSVTPSGMYYEQNPAELIKICAGCKKRYDEIRGWIPFDRAVEEEDDDEPLLLSHALCPDCTKRLYPDL